MSRPLTPGNNFPARAPVGTFGDKLDLWICLTLRIIGYTRHFTIYGPSQPIITLYTRGGGVIFNPDSGILGFILILHPVQVHVTEELSSPLFLAVLDGLDDGPEDGAGRGNRVVFQSVDIARRDEEAITFLQ